MSPSRPASSEEELESRDPAEQIPKMRLLPPSTEKSYFIVKQLIEDVNNTVRR